MTAGWFIIVMPNFLRLGVSMKSDKIIPPIKSIQWITYWWHECKTPSNQSFVSSCCDVLDLNHSSDVMFLGLIWTDNHCYNQKGILYELLTSGKLTQLWKITIVNIGKTQYFTGHFHWQTVSRHGKRFRSLSSSSQDGIDQLFKIMEVTQRRENHRKTIG